MYVCLCFGVTEKQVRAQIEAGACSPREVASACKAGTDCGGCVQRIQAILGRPSMPPKRRTSLVRPMGEAPLGPPPAAPGPHRPKAPSAVVAAGPVTVEAA